MGAHILWGIVAASTIGGIITSAMAVFAWRNRDSPAVSAFGWLMAVCAVWGFLAAARMSTTDTGTAYLLDRFVRFASSSVAPLILVFVLAYIGREDYITPLSVGALWLVPVSYGLLSVTAPLHGLEGGIEFVMILTMDGVTAPVVPEGLPSEIDLLFTYLLLVVSFALLGRFLLRSRAIYRIQATIVTTGIAIPVLVNIMTQFSSFSHPGLDLTPAALGATGLLLGWGLFRYDLLDVMPLASDILVDELPDPVFVLDEHEQVIENNHAAAEVFDERELSGRTIDEIEPGLMESVTGNSVYSLSNAGNEEITYYDPRVTSIEDQHGIDRGQLVVLRDVTGQQRRQDRLEALQAATQQFITATSVERIAELTVTFAERVLDQDATSVYIHDEVTETLQVSAASDALRDAYLDDVRVVEEPDHPVFEAYRERDISVTDISDDYPDAPFPYLLLVPIVDHGVLLIGSCEPGAFATEDEQFATILARTTQVALTQVEREQELRQSRQAFERRSEQVEFFNGVLRHTLRNALLVIEGRANHLRDHVDSSRERHLDRIVQWSEDLSELSTEIEAINDTVTATEAEQLDTVDLSGILRERIDRIAEDFGDAAIEPSIEDDLDVQANRLVEKVIDSLVSNAITHNDQPEPRVDISARTIADRVQVRIADNGPGMTDTMKETVFERNVGTSQTSHGFGLYFVSVMMNLYGGTVWIEDNDAGQNGERRGAVAVLEFQHVETQHTSQSAENDLS